MIEIVDYIARCRTVFTKNRFHSIKHSYIVVIVKILLAAAFIPANVTGQHMCRSVEFRIGMRVSRVRWLFHIEKSPVDDINDDDLSRFLLYLIFLRMVFVFSVSSATLCLSLSTY